MAQRGQTKGACQFCGKEMTRSGLSKHFKACKEYEASIQNTVVSAKSQPLYHLVAYNPWQKEYWLHLEVNGTATLSDLDAYLRAIWLECCGHLSAFSFGRGHDEIKMSSTIHTIFSSDAQLVHSYDFGDTTETVIQLVGTRTGVPLSPHPIFLMARNHAPHYPCMVCKQTASWLCLDCIYEHDEPGFLCDVHEAAHEHEEYGSMPIVNSPRFGVCGYDGPAIPPY